MHHCDWDYYSYGVAFVLVAFLKYFRLAINCVSYWSYRPVPLSCDPLYTPQDVTVVIPSLDGDGEDLRNTLLSCLRNDPYQVILVTVDVNLHKAEAMVASISTPKRILVLSISQANKRHQMCKALPLVETEITVFADDDVLWPSTLLPWMLSPFEKPTVGAVGTSQRLRRESQPNFWNFLGAAYLLRRNWDIIACNYVDGGLPCLSGRTVAYRTHIIQDTEFDHAFMNETWRSFQLNADDDNFLTRWMVNNGWDIRIQKHRDCEVQTTLEGNSKFLLQCLRWARSNWRSNLKSLVIERTVWRRHPWSTYAVLQTTLTSWSLAYDVLLAWLFWRATSDLHEQPKRIARTLVYLWIFLVCRLVKYLEHFIRYPSDLKYVLLIPLFGYFHASFIKLHAMVTLHVTTWGSREGADDNDSYRMIALPTYAPHSDNPDSKDPKDSNDSKDPKDSSFPSTSKTAQFRAQPAEPWDSDDASDESGSLLPRYSVDDDLN